ncbi:MAG: tRNA (uridine(34)/cytosine(34)/5-carboxymethylaminomethyluridine(34)-2'-O)-methyltransferase TrmL [Gammaproteobacteria bacterium]|nr:MAG: tRNA (uridine(34)/cytosine(34)/5-carboxymethylaminomethyluridine(34)-2'-O)-methyltransferase TrmL [Gammaproteobacteria bacterium]
MFHVVLFEPEIPPNTGNIIRLCANSGAQLHLIQPLGFSPTDSKLKRAGLDYHDWASVHQHENLETFQQTVQPPRLFAISTRGTRNYADVSYQPGDALLFGPETRGLPQTLLDGLPSEHTLRIPMQPHNRSLNLSNAVAIVLYEAWRQQGFAGAD